MNLADIRKKAELDRRAAAAVPVERSEPSLPAKIVTPEPDFFEEMASVTLEEPVEEPLHEPCIYDDHLLEQSFSMPQGSIYNDEHLFVAAPEPPVEIGPEEPAATAPPHIPVATVRKAAGFNPVQTILSGRDAAMDADDTLYQAHLHESEDVQEYLCFRVASEEYAINIMAIKEIVKPRDVTEVPRMPLFISGVISLRGVITPVMNMRLRLSHPLTAATGRERIVVLKRDSGYCGILVDEVIQVARIKKSDVEDPPTILDGIDREFVTGLGHFDKRMLILLNLDNILDIGVH